MQTGVKRVNDQIARIMTAIEPLNHDTVIALLEAAAVALVMTAERNALKSVASICADGFFRRCMQANAEIFPQKPLQRFPKRRKRDRRH